MTPRTAHTPGFTTDDFTALADDLRAEIAAAGKATRRKLTLPLREAMPASFGGRPWVWELLTTPELIRVTPWTKQTIRDYQAAHRWPPDSATIGTRRLYAVADVAVLAATIAPMPATLTAADITAIRTAVNSEGASPAEVAARYGIRRRTAVLIAGGGHIYGDISDRRETVRQPRVPPPPLPQWTRTERHSITLAAMVNMFRDLIRATPSTTLAAARQHAAAAGLPAGSRATASCWVQARYWEAPALAGYLDPVDPRGLVTVTEAAAAFGAAPGQVRAALRAGQLIPAGNTGRRVLLDPARLRCRRDGRLPPADRDHPLALPLPDEKPWEEITP